MKKRRGERTKARVNTENLEHPREKRIRMEPKNRIIVEMLERVKKNFDQIFTLIPLPDILPTSFLAEFTLAKGYGSGMCFVKIRNRIFFLPRIVRILRFSQRFMNIPNRECQNIERRSAAGFLHDTHRGGRRAQARKGDKC